MSKKASKGNSNYRAGRRFEYDRVKHWRSQGYKAWRSAGSHGLADVIAVCHDRGVILIQCKVVSTEAEMKRLIGEHRQSKPIKGVHFRIEVKIKGSNEVHSWTI